MTELVTKSSSNMMMAILFTLMIVVMSGHATNALLLLTPKHNVSHRFTTSNLSLSNSSPSNSNNNVVNIQNSQPLNLFNSSTLLNSTDVKRLYNEILHQVKDKSQLRLIYRASQDGYESFHNKCDDAGPTVVLIKSKNGCVFGGYTSLSWKRGVNSKPFRQDDSAFIFSIYGPNGEERFSVLKSSGVKPPGIRVYPWPGPIFGWGPDIGISLRLNGELHGVSQLGLSYKPSDNSILQPIFYLTGSITFPIADYEVFTLQ